ncbi:MAG TPA: hypothetical protein VLT90_13110 [Terriglobales bacterium]|nr:hypothetical protein [Terriglobales bacterium]
MAQSHVLRVIADRIDLGWSKPSGIRFRPGTVVISFENQDDIEDWLAVFGCSEVEDRSFATLKARYSIKSFVGSWFFERILIVQCEKAKIDPVSVLMR